ncbi:hypothetical protein GCM10011529_16490 [Polymorphobacter glacialis]|uniref:Uncharacterized protein n=1 Tax=Sandarakinorhabdus glacialis TaxID=1614636 RepID=A0A916ZSI4_9SPHN|nr:hypothetical protein [Polymorphobacter glacialis]GGE10789.1 hypothetical protein GCM10011529_16490 [Polymorphobacter glacialis]
MADPGTVIDRNEERLQRLAMGEAAQRARSRRRQRTTAKFGKRVARAGMTGAAIILALILWGLIIGPVGTTVLVLAVLFGLFATMAAAISVRDEPEPRNLGEAAPAALPAATDAWLDRRRRELPRLAAPQVDAISAKLATLETQLAAASPADPVAQDLQRLLGKHLPELVERYTRVPAEQRARTLDDDGRTIETTLIDGLKVVDAELARASDALAAADRDAMVVHGKFLESRYNGDPSV